MKEGHPYQTKHLDQLRSEHRRILSAIRENAIDNVVRGMKAFDERPEDANAIEWALRNEIERHREQDPALVAAILSDHERRLLRMAAPFVSEDFGGLIETLRGRPGLPPDPVSSADEWQSLYHLTNLLLVAERFTDDDWVDPRLVGRAGLA